MAQLLCNRCKQRVYEDEATCPYCGHNLRKLFAVIKHTPGLGPPKFFETDWDQVFRPNYILRGLRVGGLTGAISSLPAVLATVALLGGTSMAGVALDLVLIEIVLLVFGGCLLGYAMGREEDFENEGSYGLCLGLSALYVLAVLALFVPYFVVPAGLSPFILRIMVGYVYRRYYGESWQVG